MHSCFSTQKSSFLKNDKYSILTNKINFELIIDLELNSLDSLTCYIQEGQENREDKYHNHFFIEYSKSYAPKMDSIINTIKFEEGDTLFCTHLVSDEYNSFMVDDGNLLRVIHLENNETKVEIDKSIPRDNYFYYKEYLTNCPDYCSEEGGYIIVFSIFIKLDNNLKYKTNWCCYSFWHYIYSEVPSPHR